MGRPFLPVGHVSDKKNSLCIGGPLPKDPFAMTDMQAIVCMPQSKISQCLFVFDQTDSGLFYLDESFPNDVPVGLQKRVLFQQ